MTDRDSVATRWLGVSWWLLLGAVIVLPAITSAEYIEFRLIGIELNGRFVAYAAAATVAAVGAAAALLSRSLRFPPWLILAAVFLAWLMVTTAAALQPPREWFPSLLRWLLYFSAAVVAIGWATRHGWQRATSLFVTSLALAVIIPAAWGLFELVTGSAPMLNDAPRISGSMVGHPVAFSLMLIASSLILLPFILQFGRRRLLAGVAGLLLLYALILFTYTRLTTVVALLVGMTTVAFVPAVRQVRLRRAAIGCVMGIALFVVAIPFLDARFDITISPGGPGSEMGEGSEDGSAIDIGIDNSTALRMRTHELGFGYVAASPVLGHGVGSFDRLFAEDTGLEGVAPHDDLLLVAVESGVIGFAMFVALYGMIGITLLLRVLRAPPGTGSLQVGSLAAFGAVNVLGVIHNPTYFPEFQLPIWIALALSLTISDPQER
ncbi:MAG: O-antigen ligase family protein [Candidatus Limnocylindria bacterium]